MHLRDYFFSIFNSRENQIYFFLNLYGSNSNANVQLSTDAKELTCIKMFYL